MHHLLGTTVGYLAFVEDLAVHIQIRTHIH